VFVACGGLTGEHEAIRAGMLARLLRDLWTAGGDDADQPAGRMF
jgi:hypothetical protein